METEEVMDIFFLINLEVTRIMKEITKIRDFLDKEYFYLKCKTAFQTCITNKDNDYLQAEIDVPINQLDLRHNSINLSFNQELEDNFIIDIKIILFSNVLNKELGYYQYQEDMNGEFVDEFLVFY